MSGVQLFSLQKSFGQRAARRGRGSLRRDRPGRTAERLRGHRGGDEEPRPGGHLGHSPATWPGRWGCRCGWPCSMSPDWRWLLDVRTAPGIPPCGCSARPARRLGGRVPPDGRAAARQLAAAAADHRRDRSGELIDKITILEIKSERIPDAARHHVGTELAAGGCSPRPCGGGLGETGAGSDRAEGGERGAVADRGRDPPDERDRTSGPGSSPWRARSTGRRTAPPSSSGSMSCSGQDHRGEVIHVL